LGRRKRSGKVIGFYTDEDGTVRPITKRSFKVNLTPRNIKGVFPMNFHIKPNHR